MNKLDPKFKEEIAHLITGLEGKDLRYCFQCSTCTTVCPVREVDKKYDPKKIVRAILLGMKDYFTENPKIPYSCNLCELCEKVCPQGVNVGQICLTLREQLVEKGQGPLPPHKMITDEEERVFAKSYILALPDPNVSQSKRAFFPGCNLPGYSPSLAMVTYDYLRERLPGTGLILRCCGAPYHGLGMHHNFQEKFIELESEMNKIGATELIVPCPDCFRTLKRTTPKFELKSLWEVLAEIGIPQAPQNGHHTFSLHDSCTARWETKLQDSVREVIRLAGHQIEELTYSRELTRCCGMGGLIAPLDLFRVHSLGQLRVAETHFDMLTYCAACRENLSIHKPSLHVLDLLFNPNWPEDINKRPNKPSVKTENQLQFRALILDRIGKP
ncbi:(Fe-S)-binding protein [Chloroflexota bacterium]